MSIGYQVKYTLIVILKNSECSQTNCWAEITSRPLWVLWLLDMFVSDIE
jgi:hypothetical protein